MNVGKLADVGTKSFAFRSIIYPVSSPPAFFFFFFFLFFFFFFFFFSSGSPSSPSG